MMITSKKRSVSKLFFALLMALASLSAQAQDKEFWFAAPDIAEHTSCGDFDAPIIIAISNATTIEGDVKITFYNGGSKIEVNGKVPAGGLYKYDIAKAMNGRVENPRGLAGTVTNYGIHIETTVPVTAYYQVLPGCNQDVWSLKGSSALGTEFYVPMVHDSYYHTGSSYDPLAFDQIDIVAVEDGTEVTVVPKKQIKLAPSGTLAAGVSKTWTLNKGQTLKIMENTPSYTMDAANASLGGTKITSTKPIAVTTTEDLVGRTTPATGWDVIGDQIVPIDKLGANYVVIKGYLGGSDRAYLVATQNGTTITINTGGTPISSPTLNAGSCWVANLGNNGNIGGASSNPQAVFIEANHPIYCYHVSGVKYSGDELGSGLMPSIYSIGQTQLSFYAYAGVTSGTRQDQHRGFMVFRAGTHDKFTYKVGNGTFQALSVTPIDVPGMTDWKAAKVDFGTALHNKIVTIRNSHSPFSYGYFSINSQNGGASYGYLSAFGDFRFPDYTYKCVGQPTTLRAGYGMSYKWWKGQLADKPTNPANFISTTEEYVVPANGEGYYTVEVNQDSRTVTATTYVKNDVLNLVTAVPALVKKGSTVSPTAAVDNADGKGFLWSFGAGATPATSTNQNPTGVSWSSVGNKTVSLAVSYTSLGCTGESKNHTVLVYDMQNDYAQAIKGAPITIDVLANDDFSACATPTIGIVSQGIKGFAKVEGNKVKYTPNAGALGNDSFTYTVTCGGNTSEAATVQVYIAEKPDNVSDASCWITPPSQAFTIKELARSADNVYCSGVPLTGDIDNDGTVEIVVPGGDYPNGYTSTVIQIYELNGTQLTLQQSLSTPSFYSGYGAPYCLAKVDGGSYAAIFLCTSNRELVKYTYNGTSFVESKRVSYSNIASKSGGIPMAADIDGDGNAEIAVFDKIFDAKTLNLLANGNLLSTAGMGFGLGAYPVGGYGSYMAIADMDGDGIQEVIGGDCVYKVDLASNPKTFTLWSKCDGKGPEGETHGDVADGCTAVADMDGDGLLDVVVTVNGDANPMAGTLGSVYVWNPRTKKVIHKNVINSIATINGIQGPSAPFIGDIDKDGEPEICFTSYMKMYAYEYNPTTKELDKKWERSTSDASSCTTMSMFDFNQDGSAELVYRDETHLRIIDGETGLNLPSGTFEMVSGTVNEYPIVADVNSDGAAEIIVTGSSTSTWVKGRLWVFASNPVGTWGPARKVWNQTAYNVVNVNNDLTIPRYPINPSLPFPNGRRPYNSFLQQATTLNANGDMLFLAPQASFSGQPTYMWETDKNRLTITLKVENIGDADLVAPVYATAYKNSIALGNQLGTGTCATNIAPGGTGNIAIVIDNISSKLPITSIVIQLNDNNGSHPVQKQCEDNTNQSTPKPLASLPRAVNDKFEVRSGILSQNLDILANDSYGCAPSNLSVSLVAPLSLDAAVAAINSSNKLNYQSANGRSVAETLRYQIKCNDSDDVAVAKVELFIAKIVKVSVVDSKHSAGEGGSPKAKLRFELEDDITHSSNIEVTYSLSNTSEIANPLGPVYKAVIPAGTKYTDVELTAAQNYIVQGNRELTVTIVGVQ